MVGSSGQPEVSARPCLTCGGHEVEPGFVDDDRQGRVRWIAGLVERGPFGNAAKLGRRKTSVIAYRCTGCGRLELYARDV